jgi:hypothetical protein
VVYEGYGPGGVAILVEALTNNRNRTASEVRHLFDRHGGTLGEPGSVAWTFEKKGEVVVGMTTTCKASTRTSPSTPSCWTASHSGPRLAPCRSRWTGRRSAPATAMLRDAGRHGACVAAGRQAV